MSAGKVFLSYRRDDTAGHAGRLFDRLNAHFPNRIFMDVVGLEPGADFVDEIDRAVGSCEVLIALIGKQWLNIRDASGRRRLERSDDFVRLEVSTALRRNIRVVPALVSDTPFPAPENLPKDLVLLCRRNALRLNEGSFDHDVGRLIRTLERELSDSRPRITNPLSSLSIERFRPTPKMVKAGAGLASVAVVVTALQLLPDIVDRPSLQDRPPSSPVSAASLKAVDIRLLDDGVASVFRDGQPVGTTPFTLRGQFGEQVELMFRRPGYRDRHQSIQISERTSYLITMEREE